jgi:hypothetical protein
MISGPRILYIVSLTPSSQKRRPRRRPRFGAARRAMRGVTSGSGSRCLRHTAHTCKLPEKTGYPECITAQPTLRLRAISYIFLEILGNSKTG